jgi:hypothetical protein
MDDKSGRVHPGPGPLNPAGPRCDVTGNTIVKIG